MKNSALSRAVVFGIVGATLAFLGQWTFAQTTPPTTPPTAPPAATPAKKKELPPVEDVTMETSDKVLLRASWFGSNLEKEAIPVVLLPSWTTTRQELLPIAAVLQRDYGCAVIVPDWRGHGDSKTVVGVEKPLDSANFGQRELTSMIEDIETCKRFLLAKNDAGELNLDMLVVIANYDMCGQAAAWCISDWNWPLLGGKKQGQFVKMLIMISPLRKTKTTSLGDFLKSPLLLGGINGGMTTVMMYGTQHQTSTREAQAIETVLAKPRASERVARSPEAKFSAADLFVLRYASGKFGPALIEDRWDSIPEDIGALLQIKLRDRLADFPWIKYGK